MCKGTKWRTVLPAAVSAAVCFAVLFLGGCRGKSAPVLISTPVPRPDPAELLKEAASKVEEDRNEPIGRRASVEVPPELKHYADPRRFLAVQTAEWEVQKFELPHDFAELADQIIRGDLVELKPLGDDYILYGVGWKATEERLTHFDQVSGGSVPLMKDARQCVEKENLLSDDMSQAAERIKDLKRQLAKARGRAARAGLSKRLRHEIDIAEALRKERELLDSYRANSGRLSILTTEYETLHKLASDFAGQSYDLENAASLREFKIRLLSFLRPEAKVVLEAIARAYKNEFNRPLPITSLVRTEEYQRHIRETNRGAAANATPPHTMGLAFDVYYHFMSAAEQNFLMAEIGRQKAQGRVEALRETRDHIHVFVFADGRPPNEDYIAASLSTSHYTERHSSRNTVKSRRRSTGKA